MTKGRAVDAFLIWTLSIALAGLFLLTGVPKIIGFGAVGFQASAMRGFPEAMRVLVGVVECVGAIGLLVPATASFAAIVLAVVMVPASLTQYASGEGHVFVPIIVLGLLLLTAWRRNAKAVNASYHDFADHPHPLLHDGIVAGLIGAAAIAVWFLIIDTIAGQPSVPRRRSATDWSTCSDRRTRPTACSRSCSSTRSSTLAHSCSWACWPRSSCTSRSGSRRFCSALSSSSSPPRSASTASRGSSTRPALSRASRGIR